MLFGFELSPEQLKARLDSGQELLVLDVRDLGEYSIAHIDGAKLIPLNALPGRLAALEPWREKMIVIYCHQGNRSMEAMELLHDRGFRSLKMLAGGIDAWCRDIEPHKPRYGHEDDGEHC